MTDNLSPENKSQSPIEYVVVNRQAKSLLRRTGCILALIAWFIFLLTPLCMFVLAVQNEITIAHFRDVPDSLQHPFLQVQLIMEREYRGLRFVNTSLHPQGDQNLCIQTNVRYVLWEGQGDPATYCRCYTRQTAESAWGFEEQYLEACK